MNSDEKLNKINENKININDYTKEIQQLLDMGFDKQKAFDAIQFSKGNVELAIDYLYNGKPKNDNNNSMDCNLGDDDNDSDREEHGEDFEDTIYLLKNLSIIIILLSKEKGKPIEEIMAIIQKFNFRLFQFIKENEEEFKSYLSLTITDQGYELYENFKKGKETFGYLKFQYKIFDPNYSDNNIINNHIYNKNESLGNDLEEEIELDDDNNFNESHSKAKEEEKKAIKRLRELGNFSEEEAVQAYYCCDKNEELAANYLFEQINNNNINKINKINFDK
jgi:UV excision repair protein RAD23